MRKTVPLVLLVLLSACTHEPDYVPTGASGPGADFISIIAPTSNQVLTGFSAFTITISASQGITSVDFAIDGDRKATDVQPPFSYSWPSYEYCGGSHEVKATGNVFGQVADTDRVTVKLKRQNIYVDEGAAPGGVGKRDDPVSTLPQAAFLSMAGDTIHVAAGSYDESYETDTPHGTKTVCALLRGGTALVGAGADDCVIDCSGVQVGIFYKSGIDGRLVENLSIVIADEACVFVSNADPKISNCVISGSYGDGIMVRDCDRKFAKVVRCDVRSNVGSGIHVRDADLEVYYSIIENNGSAGILCERWGFPKIRRDMITSNTVGIFVDNASSPNVTNCDIFDNNVYDVELGYGQLLDTLRFRGIWWGVVDSASIDEGIYHAADDPTLPYVDFGSWLSGPVFPQPQ